MRTHSTRKAPICTGSPSGSASRSSAERSRPCSSSFDWIERERELRRPDLPHRHLAQQVRQAADVVFVAVREQHGAHARGVLLQVREVGQDEVDAELLVARERESGVHDDDLAVDLVDHGVLADLAEAAERNDPQNLVRHRGSISPRLERPWIPLSGVARKAAVHENECMPVAPAPCLCLSVAASAVATLACAAPAPASTRPAGDVIDARGASARTHVVRAAPSRRRRRALRARSTDSRPPGVLR